LTDEAGPEVEIRRAGGRGNPGGPRLRPPHLAARPTGEGELVAHEEREPGQPQPAIVRVNLTAADGASPGSYELQPGDVVHVAKRALKPVYVLGLVHKPGEFPYPLSQELRVLDSLALAGGVSNPVADQVIVIRQLPGESAPISIAVGIQRAKAGQDNLRLAPGDTVIVEQNAATAVVDIVSTFFRIGFSAGLPLF
jgi:polysaccharide export outer membrane protein